MTVSKQEILTVVQALEILPADTPDARTWNKALTAVMENVDTPFAARPQPTLPLSEGERLAAHLVEQPISVIQEAFRILEWPRLRFTLSEEEA